VRRVPAPDAQRAADTLTALQNEASRDVVAEALEAVGTSPLTPKNAAKRVQDLSVALLAQQRAGEAAQHYERPVLQQFRDAMVEHIDDMILEMRPYFDHAAEVFHSAGTTLEPGAAPSVHDGMAAVQTYAALDDAQRMVSNVLSARVKITELAGYTQTDVTWYIESAADAEALRLARVMATRGAHHLTRAGYRLRLNTRAEAKQVEAEANRSSQARANDEVNALRVAARDPLREAALASMRGESDDE
jgi:hypothetical protein